MKENPKITVFKDIKELKKYKQFECKEQGLD